MRVCNLLQHKPEVEFTIKTTDVKIFFYKHDPFCDCYFTTSYILIHFAPHMAVLLGFSIQEEFSY